jgi:energy-coupling factor transport system substrate-specific component
MGARLSWQAGTMALVLLAIGAGMLWYERSRPPSQIVALVAVLAALAVAGRIVLAPIPNVVATTDIVLFAGYALGPAPGFAVGALGGLVSNFWLGQGVWTPWQMVGWGMTGVAGGVLWRITRGNANRWTLAAACGAAGLVFGMWMNFQTMVSFGGEISLDRYLALEARAIPFDLAHITGNVIFALAAGPAMVAALRRFRERFEWRQATGLAGVLLVTLALGTITFAPDAQAAPGQAARDAAGWLREEQNSDGGFGASPESDSSVSITARAMLGLAASEVNPLDVRSGGRSPLAFLKTEKRNLDDPNDIALVILALRTVGQNPRNFEDRNLVEALERRRGPENSFGNRVNVAAFAALAFRSAGASGPASAVAEWLKDVQNRSGDGGWGIADGSRSDPDSTGTVLQVISAPRAVGPAISYLEKVQKSSGGFASGSVVNSQSTGLVLQALSALGRSPNALVKNGNSGLDFIRARQQDDGSIWYSKDSDQTRTWVTADALVGLSGKSLPVGEPRRAPKPAPPSGSGGSGSSGNGSGGSAVPDLSGGSGSSASPSPSSTPDGFGSGQGTGSGSSGSPADGQADPIEPVPDPVPDPPALDQGLTEPAFSAPVIPSAELVSASQAGSGPSPAVAVLICFLVTGALAGGTALLARRFRW